ncbi:hypothetical protein BV25DRAFT_1390313 [Artomyces pyxidatus]|uniref:Uncharacterized protein n=1 Tax=Artomyces pyxidatus TaxID=48021 RepID=A0ACB8TDJ4_9AGAM|nr:hypothetical protein BV25DRAFT_1390313 [Artomyces pyxidatus]
MPLNTAQNPLDLSSFDDIKEQFVIFYSSRDEEGKMWCPDCRAVEDLVERTFSPIGGPSALVIYVGQKPEWKTPDNPFRGPAWDVQSVPTIVRLSNVTLKLRLGTTGVDVHVRDAAEGEAILQVYHGVVSPSLDVNAVDDARARLYDGLCAPFCSGSPAAASTDSIKTPVLVYVRGRGQALLCPLNCLLLMSRVALLAGTHALWESFHTVAKDMIRCVLCVVEKGGDSAYDPAPLSGCIFDRC